jgi:uncharacterized protein
MLIVAAIGMVLVLGVAWIAQLIGLPGNWLIVLAAAAYAWLFPDDSSLAISWHVVLALVALAVIGELAELAASAMGVAKAGGSRRGVVLAILGSIVGSVVGIVVGLPIPIIGSLAAAIVFGGLGALAGAVIAEQSLGRNLDSSLEIGKAAFVGRLLGTVAKIVVCSMMCVVTLAALVF